MERVHPRQRAGGEKVKRKRQGGGIVKHVDKGQGAGVAGMIFGEVPEGKVVILGPVGVVWRATFRGHEAQDDLRVPAVAAALQVDGGFALRGGAA